MPEGSIPLDSQHETFACLIAEGKTSQGQAYVDAGYDCKSIEVAYASASRLLRNVKVQCRITYLKEEAADKACLDASYILSRLVMNSEDARDSKQYAASNRALELLGKHLGLFSDSYVIEERTPSP